METAIDLSLEDTTPMYTYVRYQIGSAHWDIEQDTPEQKLYFAVLERAWRDMEPQKLTWIRKDAAEWFISSEEEMPSFLYAAGVLGLQPGVIKRFIDFAREAYYGIPPDERREAAYIQRRFQAYWTQETYEARHGRIRYLRCTKAYIKQKTFGALISGEGTED